jgi:hypothetical protein
VAGGHGMWGLARSPVTGRPLAEQSTTAKQSEAMREFNPYTDPAARPSPPAVHTARDLPPSRAPDNPLFMRGHHHNDHPRRCLDDTAGLHPPAG